MRLSGTLTTNLTVSMYGNLGFDLIPIGPVTIPAGQTNAHFSLYVGDNAVIDPLRIAQVTVTAPGFTDGVAGAFFRPLGIAYILAIMASLATALTVTPALSLLLLPSAPLKRHEAPLARVFERIYLRLITPLVPRWKTAATIIVLARLARRPLWFEVGRVGGWSRGAPIAPSPTCRASTASPNA